MMGIPTGKKFKAPVSDGIMYAVAGLIDDALLTVKREPTHADLDFVFDKSGLAHADPKSQGQSVGKAKRARAVLSWAMEHDLEKAEICVASIVSLIRAKGGFRVDSPNFVGEHEITDAVNAFHSEGFVLGRDGELYPSNLESLSGTKLTAALDTYVRRARRGSEDAALLVGTGKDLLEATAKHVIQERFNASPHDTSFPALLGQAFVAVGLTTPQSPFVPGEPARCKLERALYEAGCAVNALRNREGTGHGRPWLSTVTNDEAHAAIEIIGIVSGFLLTALRRNP